MVTPLNKAPRRRLLSTFLRIESGEGLRAGLMALYYFAVVGGVVITGQLASRALFLTGLPPPTYPTSSFCRRWPSWRRRSFTRASPGASGATG